MDSKLVKGSRVGKGRHCIRHDTWQGDHFAWHMRQVAGGKAITDSMASAGHESSTCLGVHAPLKQAGHWLACHLPMDAYAGLACKSESTQQQACLHCSSCLHLHALASCQMKHSMLAVGASGPGQLRMPCFKGP